jgi:ADP-ribose pyrophosphatase YjhB (NUDIX family)
MEGWTRVAAYCVAKDEPGRVLLCRLSNHELDRAKWTLPGGGLEFGEDPQAGAIRELQEETGLHGHVAALLGIDSRVYRPNADRPTPLHGIRIVYRVDVEAGELRHEIQGSTDRAEWFSRAEIPSLPLVNLVAVALAMLDRTRPDRSA